jgi:putative FmdB family regulatory protein
MPTYEYRCKQCESSLTLTRTVDERDDEVTCDCGTLYTRVYNAPAIKFNATGFYSTGG